MSALALVPVTLTCTHQRLVDPGIAGHIRKGQIETLWCHKCQAAVEVAT